MLGGFKWVENKCKINKDFIKSYNEHSDELYFLEVYVQYRDKLHGLHNILPFLTKRMKFEKIEKL